MALAISSESKDGATCVRVSGEVDVSCADELREALVEVASRDVSSLEVDLAEVPYIDSTGIGVLVGAARRATAEGVGFAVVRPQRNVARIFGMLGLSDELHVRDVASRKDE